MENIDVKALEKVLKIARCISEDLSDEVEAVLQEGLKNPLGREEMVNLFREVAQKVRLRAVETGDVAAVASIEKYIEEVFELVGHEEYIPAAGVAPAREHTVHLQTFNGIKPGAVLPRPWFHGKEIPMNCGYIKTTQINLWGENVRLDIHISQFKSQYGRKPKPEELLRIMEGTLPLPGITEENEFEIEELARSIASNGVRKPPIIDIDGTLLDGNRRVTACYYILNSDEFTSEQKKRAEHVFVWQMAPDATDDDRRKVVVSLNFERDHKMDWPPYVKARRVYEDWQAMLVAEQVKPGPQRQTVLKRELSERYALGPDTAVVSRFIKMVEWADDFEDYHIGELKKDKYTVQHKSSRYFQYFEELSKGAKPGGVAFALNSDEAFKKVVFDLLYDDKFKNWTQLRKLGRISENDEARDRLRLARDTSDHDKAEELIDDAISIADTKRADQRMLGANTRIETFVKWLEELPVKAFRDEIRPENLKKLLHALKLVETNAKQALEAAA